MHLRNTFIMHMYTRWKYKHILSNIPKPSQTYTTKCKQSNSIVSYCVTILQWNKRLVRSNGYDTFNRTVNLLRILHVKEHCKADKWLQLHDLSNLHFLLGIRSFAVCLQRCSKYTQAQLTIKQFLFILKFYILIETFKKNQ